MLGGAVEGLHQLAERLRIGLVDLGDQRYGVIGACEQGRRGAAVEVSQRNQPV
jgi:hypothetical protein